MAGHDLHGQREKWCSLLPRPSKPQQHTISLSGYSSSSAWLPSASRPAQALPANVPAPAVPFVAWAGANAALAGLTLGGVAVAGYMIGWFALGTGLLVVFSMGHED